MTRLRRAAPLLAALLLLGLAAVFALLAVDVRAWQGTLRRDDVTFTGFHPVEGLWGSPAILPGDPAYHLLGLGDPLAYRHALQLFWVSQVGVAHVPAGSVTVTRVSTENELQTLADHAKTSAERSVAANLLGVMTITTPTADSATQVQTLERAAAYFRQAVTADPANYAAKLNLELLLRLQRPAKTRFGADSRGGFGPGGSHGAGVVGGGF
jgi:hypothetical protein